jgi:hypothetical protein
MKVALYIEDGLSQVVLTPQNKAEQDILKAIDDQARLFVRRGQFYENHYGWVRHTEAGYTNALDSTILVLRPAESGHAEPGADVAENAE